MPNQLYQDDPASQYDPIIIVGAGEAPPSSLYRNIGQIGTEGNMQDVYTTTPAPQPEQGTVENTPPGVDPLFWQSAIKTLGYDPMKINPVKDAMGEWQANEKAAFNRVFSGTGMTETNMTPDALKYWNELKQSTLAQLTDMYKTKFTVGKQMLDYMTTEFEKQKKITAHQTVTPEGKKVYTNEYGQPTNVEVPPSPPSEQERKDIKQEMTILKMTNDVQKLFKNDYVGPVAGRYGQLAEKFTDLPEEQVKFYATIRDINDFVLRVRSGAQINEQEYKRLTSFLMDANLPPDNFKARLERFSQNIDWILGLERKMAETSNKTSQAEITPPASGTKGTSGKKGKFTIIRVK